MISIYFPTGYSLSQVVQWIKEREIFYHTIYHNRKTGMFECVAYPRTFTFQWPEYAI